MVPALYDGDIVLVQRRGRVGGATPRSGSVVVARFRSMPQQLVIKRAVASRDGGWLLASDNPFASGDSSVHGLADVEGVARLRWSRGLVWPRRLHSG